MKQVERDVTARHVQALPHRRFHRYPVLPPGVDSGPLQHLPGKWVSGDTGWNMIALPFPNPAGPPFRLLLNQYKETLRFSFIDEKVPNRGVTETRPRGEKDQLVVTLVYELSIEQVAVQMASTFWIHELAEPDPLDGALFVLQYLQDVSLDFFPRLDMPPGLIRWPHISINTLRKVPEEEWKCPEPWAMKP
ncbi:hypothetical protein [Roseateles asaccharophilus]|uniref:Uncharacterized protein n=1 Tax=Roseateles asaccharophilus TaxID=582607 RepID=A0ABU2A975_9BURK|nr:hypothetical protein [Roseateles asaccharophilus]MDR7333756.1 hypothetical protein [Roseateles asaccharophilus]